MLEVRWWLVVEVVEALVVDGGGVTDWTTAKGAAPGAGRPSGQR